MIEEREEAIKYLRGLIHARHRGSKQNVVAIGCGCADTDTILTPMDYKKRGSAAFRASHFDTAYTAYSRGIAALTGFDESWPPCKSFGLLSPPRSAAQLDVRLDAQRVAQLVLLLTNRAAAALKLWRSYRALVDTEAALALVPACKQAEELVTLPKVIFRRAQALLSVGAFSAARTLLAPQADDDQQLATLLETARLRDERAHREASELLARPQSEAAVEASFGLTRYVGSMELRELSGGRGRGWVACEEIAAGALLLLEPAVITAPPESMQFPLPLLEAIADALTAADGAAANGEAARLRDALGCLHPLQTDDGGSEAPPTEREERARPLVEAISEATGLPLARTLRLHQVVTRNQFAIRSRGATGEGEVAVDYGVGLFPLIEMHNHSCAPNSRYTPVASGRAIAVVATRDIGVGEEVSICYIDVSLPCAQRRHLLQTSYSFVCACERCRREA